MYGPRTRRPIKDRFWEKVNKNGPQMSHMDTPCWVWTDADDGYGYGQFHLNGRTVKATTVSLDFANQREPCGRSPNGMDILHRCDNPPCIRPDHLFLGTATDNLRDASKKGRCATQRHPDLVKAMHARLRAHPELRARGDRSGSRTHPERRPRGEANNKAVLSDEQVTRMRELRGQGYSYSQLAILFHCTKSTAHRIVKRLTRADAD